jgi:hypothetical protein
MGIIVNFTDSTVQGLTRDALRITAANDVIVEFKGGSWDFEDTIFNITSGSMDRVTGDVRAESTGTDKKTGKIFTTVTYELQCKAAQRIF